jgi:hypothetical protein
MATSVFAQVTFTSDFEILDEAPACESYLNNVFQSEFLIFVNDADPVGNYLINTFISSVDGFDNIVQSGPVNAQTYTEAESLIDTQINLFGQFLVEMRDLVSSEDFDYFTVTVTDLEAQAAECESQMKIATYEVLCVNGRDFYGQSCGTTGNCIQVNVESDGSHIVDVPSFCSSNNGCSIHAFFGNAIGDNAAGYAHDAYYIQDDSGNFRSSSWVDGDISSGQGVGVNGDVHQDKVFGGGISSNSNFAGLVDDSDVENDPETWTAYVQGTTASFLFCPLTTAPTEIVDSIPVASIDVENTIFASSLSGITGFVTANTEGKQGNIFIGLLILLIVGAGAIFVSRRRSL